MVSVVSVAAVIRGESSGLLLLLCVAGVLGIRKRLPGCVGSVLSRLHSCRVGRISRGEAEPV